MKLNSDQIARVLEKHDDGIFEKQRYINKQKTNRAYEQEQFYEQEIDAFMTWLLAS